MNTPPKNHRARVILDSVSRAYPDAWREIEHFRQLKGAKLPQWPDWCYTPLAAAYAVVSGGGQNRIPINNMLHIAVVGALAAWRVGQVVMRFDPALYASLIETPITGDLPTNFFYNLPVWCVYIETPDFTIQDRPLFGVFVHLDWSPEGQPDELRILLDFSGDPENAIFQDDLLPVPLIFGEGTISDALKRLIASGTQQVQSAGYQVDAPSGNYQEAESDLAPIISLILYLCSEVATEKYPKNPIPTQTRRGGLKLFPTKDVAVWDVGTRIGAALRSAYHAEETQQSKIDSETGHARPRAHIRRAHWHTFLSGVGRSVRKLKWLPPIPVNLADIDSLPTTINPIK